MKMNPKYVSQGFLSVLELALALWRNPSDI